MDIQPVNQTQPVSDDQELAKVLAGVNNTSSPQADSNAPSTDTGTQSGLQFEESPVPPPASPAPAASEPVAPVEPAPTAVVPPAPAPSMSTPNPATTGSPELDSIKKDALEELRPLVTKLDLPADEKFDTLLLIIRSTDDQSLLGAAHDAAKSITDESRRAQALLDVIKEIDYFSSHNA